MHQPYANMRACVSAGPPPPHVYVESAVSEVSAVRAHGGFRVQVCVSVCVVCVCVCVRGCVCVRESVCRGA